MHRSKKMTVMVAAVAMLMGAGMSSAMAERSDDNGSDHKVTICHATHSAKNPFVRIHVDKNSVKAQGHAGHHDDIISDDDANDVQCPTAPGNGDDHEVTICHFISEGKYERIHTSEDDDATLTEHGAHDNDEIIRDDHDFWQCPGTHDDGDDEDEGNGNCSASSTSGDQSGLVNVHADNAAANVLCQAKVLNHVTAAVLGHAIGGSGDTDPAGEGCTASSDSGDQRGLVNVHTDNLAANMLCQASVLNHLTAAVLGHAIGGSGDTDPAGEGCIANSDSGDQRGLVNVHADNAAANVLCQSEILNYLNASVLGASFGGSSLGSGLLTAGPGGLLTGLTADVNVLANVLVTF